MAVADAIILAEWFIPYGYKPVHHKPLHSTSRGDDPLRQDSWAKSNKHKCLKNEDTAFLRQYVAIALAAGTTLHAEGIHLQGHGFVHLDLARTNSCINAGLVELNETTGVFELTRKGTLHLLDV